MGFFIVQLKKVEVSIQVRRRCVGIKTALRTSLRRQSRLGDHLAPALDVAVQQLRWGARFGLHVEARQALNHLGLGQHLGHFLTRSDRGSLGFCVRKADNAL